MIILYKIFVSQEPLSLSRRKEGSRATTRDCPYRGPHFMFPRQKFSRSENFCLGRQSFMVALRAI